MTITTYQQSHIPIGEGRPTREELLVHYPAKFTWTQLKTFINSGDLGLLKRDKKLQKRYSEVNVSIALVYGSVTNYLVNYRLQWGKADTFSFLSPHYDPTKPLKLPLPDGDQKAKGLPPLPLDAPKYFTADISPEYISVTYNDWPYSVPPEIEHSLIWSRMPFLPDVIPEIVRQRVDGYGLWGFTGCLEPPPPPSTLPSCLGALSEWNITSDKLKIPPKCTVEEEALLEEIGKEIDQFVLNRWPERDWETAWFVNPPRLQSIPQLSHVHIFAKRKISN